MFLIFYSKETLFYLIFVGNNIIYLEGLMNYIFCKISISFSLSINPPTGSLNYG